MSMQSSVAQTYRNNQIATASPVERVLMVYDVAINACAQRELERLSRALRVLKDALAFEYGDVAYHLFNIYQWCDELGREGEYDQAADLLRDLRNTWATAVRALSATAADAEQPVQVRHDYNAAQQQYANVIA